jgi:drug/metabolite transporter (DMT)-like permease
VSRPPTQDLTLMGVGVVAVSTSAPLIAAAAAPALAIAFWRNALATGVLLPVVAVRARAEVRRLSARERRLAIAAGGLLAAHFATWVPSVKFTSVAASTALVTVQPVWAALLARLQGQRIPAAAWSGIGIAVIGAMLITGVDLSVSARALGGDALALVGGFLAAAYVTVGGTVRRSVTTLTYTTICYGCAALALLAVCGGAGSRLAGYSTNAWLKIAGLTVGAQFLGHSVFNRVLRTTSATVVSIAILFEAPGAAVIARIWLHQRPRPLTLLGLAVLVVGVAVVIATGRGQAVPAE